MTRRRSRTGSEGIRGIDLAVSFALLGIVVSGVAGVLWSAASSLPDRDVAAGGVPGAVHVVANRIRAASVVYPPTDGGMRLVVASSPTAPGASWRWCVEWRVSGDRLVQRGWRSDRSDPGSGAWRVLAGPVANRAPDSTADPVPAFALSRAATDRPSVVVSILPEDEQGGTPVTRVVPARLPAGAGTPEGCAS